MDWNEPEPKIQYLSSQDGAKIVSCRGPIPAIRLPGTIGGLPVRGICPYAFSSPDAAAERLPDGTEIRTAAPGRVSAPEPRLRFLGGSYLREAWLPSGLREIGEYAFYNCTQLARLHLFGGGIRVGNGAFMNCGSLAEIEFFASASDGTCLSDLLAEISGEILIFFRNGGECSAFPFPEYYEESVENGPARIFEHKILGVGYRYRQCFEGARLKTEEYDRQFTVCVPQMELKSALLIAWNRLKYSYGLRDSARRQYLGFLAENAEAALLTAVRKDDPRGILFLAGLGVLSPQSITAAVEEASRKGDAECLSVLLNERHRLFPGKKKTFDF